MGNVEGVENLTAAQRSQDERRRGVRTWWRSLRVEVVLLGGLVLALASFYLVMNVRGALALSRYQEELTRRGDTLERPPMSPEKWAQMNASREVAARLKELGPYSQAFETLLNAFPQARHGKPVDLVAFVKGCLTNSPPTLTAGKPPETQEEAASLILEVLAERETFIAELRSVCQRPELVYPFGYDNPGPDAPFGHNNSGTSAIPRVFDAINACRELRVRVLAHLALGKVSEALDDLDLMLRISDSLGRSPEIISLIISTSCRQIALTTLGPPLAERRFGESDLTRLQMMLGPVDLISGFPRAARCDRNWAVAQVEYMRKAGKYDLVGLKGGGLLRWLPSGWLLLEKVTTAKHCDAYFVDAFAEWPKRVRVDSLGPPQTNFVTLNSQTTLQAFWQGTLLARMLVPKLTESGMNTITAQVMSDQARISCALERYYLRHGQYPESLKGVVPELLEELPRDPLSGEVYRYALDGRESYRVWSVGPNQKDDGGSPGTTGRYSDTDADWVWKAW